MTLEVVKALALPPLLGTLVTVWLYGATCMQVYVYYNNFESDSNQLKAFVAFIIILETAHALLVSQYIYYYLVEHYGELTYLARSAQTVAASVFIGLVITWTVNQFLVRRIYILSNKNFWLSALISVLATVRPAFGVTATVYSVNYPEWQDFVIHVRWIITTGLAIGVLVDGLIALCISYYLLRGRDNVVVSTVDIINTLLKYTLNTGVILMIVAVLELVGVVAWPHSLAFLGVFQVQIQLYANCFLAILNARQIFRKAMERGSPMVTLAAPGMEEQEVYD